MMRFSAMFIFLVSVLFMASLFYLTENFVWAATIIDVQIQTNGDDAYAIPGASTFDRTGDIIQAGQQEGEDVYGGWRFKNIHVPSEATITTAYVEFNQEGLDGGDTITTLAFEDSGSPAAFYSGNTPADRWSDRTSFEASFTFVEGQSGDWHQTPSLVDGLQELVDNYGALKDVVLLESGSGAPNGHSWRSHDGDKVRSAKLHIEYDEGGSPGGSTSCLNKAAHENYYFSGEDTFQIAPVDGNVEADLGACGAPRLGKNKKEKGAYDNIVIESLNPGRYRVQTLGEYGNGSTTQSDEIIRIVATDGDWIDIPDLNGSDDGPNSLWGEAEVDMCESNGSITIRGYNQVHPSTLSLDVSDIIVERISSGSCSNAPIAVISCNPSSCSGFTGELVLSNDSTDPDGVSDIIQSTWNIDGAPITPCSGVCNYTPSLAIGSHIASLTVQDTDELGDTASSLGFVVKQDIVVDFDCSVDEATWQDCVSFQVAAKELIYFKDTSTPSQDASSISTWAWTFSGGTPASSVSQNPSSVFVSAGEKSIILAATDDSGRSLSRSVVLNLILPFPGWREIPAF